MKKEFAARRLDVKSFAEQAAALDGREPLQTLDRLLSETDATRATGVTVDWTCRGELHNPGHVRPDIWLRLKASAVLPMTCQRCLAPMDVRVDVDRRFRFVPDESQAAAEDEHSEEDVLALASDFDLIELVEDELLMELPAAPRHLACPEPVTLAASDPGFEEASERQVRPFAQLGRLKPGPH